MTAILAVHGEDMEKTERVLRIVALAVGIATAGGAVALRWFYSVPGVILDLVGCLLLIGHLVYVLWAKGGASIGFDLGNVLPTRRYSKAWRITTGTVTLAVVAMSVLLVARVYHDRRTAYQGHSLNSQKYDRASVGTSMADIRQVTLHYDHALTAGGDTVPLADDNACLVTFDAVARDGYSEIKVDALRVIVDGYAPPLAFDGGADVPKEIGARSANGYYVSIGKPSATASTLETFDASYRISFGKEEGRAFVFLTAGQVEHFRLTIAARSPGLYTLRVVLRVSAGDLGQELTILSSSKVLFL